MLVIPHFISHQGCPHQCLFCNQHGLTGSEQAEQNSPVDLVKDIEQWLPRKADGQSVQLAFYGGSFTCLSQDLQENKLQAVQPYLTSGQIDSIRLSTRPDCLDEQSCRFLKKYGVTTVELGVQSMSNLVLRKSLRGHDVSDSERGIKLLKESGMRTGVQLLPGLPGESFVSFIKGVRQVCLLRPDFVRMYPALVIQGSGLESMYQEGCYVPLSLNQAVAWCCRAKEVFENAGVRVIRLGLQHTQSLANTLVAGPHHPAFGELVESRKWFKWARKMLATVKDQQRLEVRISTRDLSAFTGLKRANISRLEALGLADKLKLTIEDDRRKGEIDYAFCE